MLFSRNCEYRDNRVLNELCSPMNPSAHLLRHSDIDRNTNSEDDLFEENRRSKEIPRNSSGFPNRSVLTEWFIGCQYSPPTTP